MFVWLLANYAGSALDRLTNALNRAIDQRSADKAASQ